MTLVNHQRFRAGREDLDDRGAQGRGSEAATSSSSLRATRFCKPERMCSVASTPTSAVSRRLSSSSRILRVDLAAAKQIRQIVGEP